MVTSGKKGTLVPLETDNRAKHTLGEAPVLFPLPTSEGGYFHGKVSKRGIKP